MSQSWSPGFIPVTLSVICILLSAATTVKGIGGIQQDALSTIGWLSTDFHVLNWSDIGTRELASNRAVLVALESTPE